MASERMYSKAEMNEHTGQFVEELVKGMLHLIHTHGGGREEVAGMITMFELALAQMEQSQQVFGMRQRNVDPRAFEALNN